MEESVAGQSCKWSLLKVREGNYKSMMGAGRIWRQREHASFSSPDVLKTYANLQEGRNQVIPI
jgi:hypothetical protein